MENFKTILVSPLNWGLGHATRCVPIIKALLAINFKVIIASNGAALKLLQKEFPSLETVTLPSYTIEYPKNGTHLKWKLVLKLPQIKKSIAAEKKIVNQLIKDDKIQGIISDNRFGIRSTKIPSVYITHQLNVLSGNSTFLSSKAHQKIIKKFDECWVPDTKGDTNLSGFLGHPKNTTLNLKYTGVLSRMKKQKLPKKYDVFLLISGPETQRTLLETLLLKEFKNTTLKIIVVQGVVSEKQHYTQHKNIEIYNYMTTAALEKTINESALIVARSGYTTIMDLAVLHKKAFFIPTPGQTEQLYLAERMERLKMAPFCKQEDFTLEKLKEVRNYSGLFIEENIPDFSDLFRLFKRK